MTSALSGVTFDVWNTLVREDWPRLVHFRSQSGADASGLPQALVRSILDRAWQWNRQEWSAGRFRSTAACVTHAIGAGRTDVAGVVPVLAAAFGSLPPLAEFQFDARTRDLVGELHALGLRLGIICDTGFSDGATMRDFLSPLLPADAIDVWVFSDEIHTVKPSPANFLRACDGMGLPPRSVLHVGDLVVNDYDGARRVGMSAVVFNKWGTAPSGDAPTISDLGEIGALIRR
jgi:FMN phosphatase YigB (HAD superfamily)